MSAPGPRGYVLVVDDDPVGLRYVRMALSSCHPCIQTASSGDAALRIVESEAPDLVLSDLQMPGIGGLELLKRIRRRWPETPVILLTVEQQVSTVVEAMRYGALDYLVKPVSPEALRRAVEGCLASYGRAKEDGENKIPGIVGTSRAIRDARFQIALAARSRANVIITGETGTGKELAARAIHQLSDRRTEPFVALNCALTPSDMFESQFFGHQQGAFTGATEDHTGFVVESDGGVLLLDELECLPVTHQARLLRVLDDGAVRPLGASRSRSVDVRYLASTNTSPVELLEAGELREDLYYRLRGFEIKLPPLRDRREDIPLLAEFFVEQAGGGKILPRAFQMLEAHEWPGNVRELRNVVVCARDTSGGAPINSGHLAIDPRTSSFTAGTNTLAEMEKQAIETVLEAQGGNQSRAAEVLGIDRSTLRRKLKRMQPISGQASRRP